MARRTFNQIELEFMPAATRPARPARPGRRGGRGICFCSLASSSTHGNAYLVAVTGGGRGGAALLVDCGTPLRRLEAALAERGVDAGRVAGLLLTHRHGDHTRAMRLKHPLPQRHGFPVFAPAGVWAEADGEFGPIEPALRQVIAPFAPFRVGPFRVTAFAKPHDARDAVGFIIEAAGERLAVVTDLGTVDDGLVRLLRGAHHLIFESNHDPELERRSGRPRYLIERILGDNGHLSNEQAGAALARIVGRSTRAVLLAHLSIDCNLPQLALRAVARHLQAANFAGVLAVAPPAGPSPWYPGDERGARRGADGEVGIGAGNGAGGGARRG